MSTGTLYGIGAGPGDPELITLKGLRILRSVRVVYVPATAPGRSMAATIVRPHLSPDRQRIIELVCPPLRDRAALLRRWAELAAEVAAVLASGEDAAFVTEGDPSLYSTFQYLAGALHDQHPALRIETVPGIASPFAAAALAGTPLAMWDEALGIVPATAPPPVLEAISGACATTAVLKPSAAPGSLARLMHSNGAELTTIRRVGWPEQQLTRGPEALALAAEDYFTIALLRRRNG
ncbi:MAG TPA: precorrin-2 C(20)-methyltransferase [Dehalococcoidia bacterium]|nr:precorrin-2 C(20)-methyltransferase [Dehalococcoidia bacterium]